MGIVHLTVAADRALDTPDALLARHHTPAGWSPALERAALLKAAHRVAITAHRGVRMKARAER